MALAFAGKSVAASAISAIVRKSFDYLEKYMKAEGMKSVEERLERTLPQVQVVFDAIDMERIRDQSEPLDAWLWQLRDAVEEAEDVLDEVEYYKLEEKVKSRGNKVSNSLYKCERMFVQQFNTTFKVGTFKRMVDAMKKLDEVAAAVERFILLVDRFDPSSLRHICHQEIGNPRETSSFFADETIIGRNTERDQIVEWLIKQESDDQDCDVFNVTTFAVVGIGGIGKTTLAQAVYNDQRVKECFDQAMWVCVSNDFDVYALTRKIIQETTGGGTDVTCLNTLQEILRGNLSSKKFLLVFDDVWNDERRPDWEKLVAPLKFGQKGSKILLTTRMQSVVDIVERVLGGGTESLRLEGLQEKDLLALLNKHAFFGVNPDDYMNLQEIGKKITNKLSGSPLAAKVMGGVLNNAMDSISWNRILQENISNMEHGNEGVMKVLRLSYHHLPSHLQACFRYCSLFQEDYRFKKDKLIDLWMGSGLVQISANDYQRPEDVGEYYLSILTRKSFFELRSSEPTVINGIGGVDSCEYYVMHDLLHELARIVSKKECIRISSDDYDSVPGTVRHIRINMVNHSVITDFSKLKKLRTLDISFDKTIKERDKCHVLKKVLKVATKLRVLRVHRGPVELPNAFDNLMHLRYLSSREFPCPIIREFRCPSSLYKLYHLQMVKSGRCLWESCRLSNLVSLRHLDYSGTQTGPPPHIEQLTSLQYLHFNPKYEQISALRELKDLRYLYIHGIQNNNVEEAKLAKLAEKKNLILLSLSWHGSSPESGTEELFLDNLQPHTSLAKLTIDRYDGSRSPCWMGNLASSNLIYISIQFCPKWQHLPPLGGLPSLKYLHLRGMGAVKRIEHSFYGCQEHFGFPSLKLLSIDDFPELEEWVGMEGRNLFPQLTTLSIRRCTALRNVPVLPSTIARIDIYDVGLTTLPATYQASEKALPPKSSLSVLKISHCPNLVELEQVLDFPALEELHITDCEHVPADGLHALPFLKALSLINCPSLMASQAVIKLPSSIRELNIGLCGVSGDLLVNSLCGLTYLATLELSCCGITALPSAEVCRSLIALQRLEIVHCHELRSLDGIEELISLTELKVHKCDMLDKFIGIPSQQVCQDYDVRTVGPICSSNLGTLQKLKISNPLLLQMKLLRGISSIRRLHIGSKCGCLPSEWLMHNRNNLEDLILDNAAHLEYLPPIMASLTSLKNLYMREAMLMQSLPDLPASLESLHILACHPVLKTRCQKGRGCDWHKIEHIPDVLIEEDMRGCCWSWFHY